MASHAARSRNPPGLAAPLRDLVARRSWVVPVGGLSGLVLLSALLRTQRMDVGFWIDEALSVGIADRPLTEIPGVLRLDGSPPLYYLVLHGWMRLAGTGEAATHALSLLFALATIPVAWALARSLFGERAGWMAAALVAANPFLTQYAQETRMYALVVLLGTVAAAGFVGAFVLRRGHGWTAGFAASLAALLYTHNWAVFLAAACAAAWLALWAADRDRALLREGVLAFGAVGLLFAPWIPSLLFQAAHTGAPWAQAPNMAQLAAVPTRLLLDAPAAVLAIAAGTGAARGLRRPIGRAGRAILALGGMALVTVVLAWLASQVSPAWATRYLAVALAPLLLLAALGLSRAGRLGIVGVLVVVAVWVNHPGPTAKSNVREVAEAVEPSLAAGDLVVSTQPEQLPALAYYLDVRGLHWATLTGEVTDLGVTDWRDGARRLRATSPERDLMPLVERVPPGGRVVIVEPQISLLARWSAPWTRLVRVRSGDWIAAMRQDERFRVVAVRPMAEEPGHPNPLKATVFVREGMR